MEIKFTHLTLPVIDFEETIKFYSSVCGLLVVKDLRKDNGISVWLGRDKIENHVPDFVIVLIKQSKICEYDHLGFQFERKEEFDRMAIEFKEKIIEGPSYLSDFLGYYYLMKDPNGHIVEFTHGQKIKGI